MPLIVRVPGQPPLHVDAPVSTTDIYPTLLQLSEQHSNPGSPLLLLDPLHRRPVISFFAMHGHSAFSTVLGDYEWIRDDAGHESLLLHRTGTKADATSQSDLVNRARGILTQAMASQRGTGEFRALGYLN